MIVITGAAGFIGSALVAYLNELGHADLLLVDDFDSYPKKTANLAGKQFVEKVDREEFVKYLNGVIHGEDSNPASQSTRPRARIGIFEEYSDLRKYSPSNSPEGGERYYFKDDKSKTTHKGGGQSSFRYSKSETTHKRGGQSSLDDSKRDPTQSEVKQSPLSQFKRNLPPSGGLRGDLIIHLGARTDTAEKNENIFNHLNLSYSKTVWQYCAEHQIPLIYASSAATYGGGEHGYEDDHSKTDALAPLNPYGQSKQDFDLWALEQKYAPPRWYGLKFFNVYGPNEYHKGRMASVVWHAFRQIEETGGMKLFRSHRADVADGQQSRDFIYVKNLCQVIGWLAFEAKNAENGLYNLGTGQARSFLDLVQGVFKALGRESKINFIDTPADIRDTYQYFTEANMRKLRAAGYPHPFHSLEDGIEDYVKNYLNEKKYY